jgi:N-acetylglucosamine kinase-like BadF-type ATPase
MSKIIKIKIVADSGSTKTDWEVILSPQKTIRFSTPGFNPFFVNSDFISDEIRKAFPKGIIADQISSIFFYGAGCSSEQRQKVISDGIKKVFRNAVVEINHDLLGAARSLFGNSEGIAAILGTGSNSCHYKGRKIIHNVTSLGFILGDEGSGAYLGKRFAAALLSDELPEKLSGKFYTEYKLSKDEILTSVYSKPFPNRFLASFTRFLASVRSEPVIREMLISGFMEFFDHQICKYKNYKKLPVRCVGSVAYHFSDELISAAESKGAKIDLVLESPLEALVKYHSV